MRRNTLSLLGIPLLGSVLLAGCNHQEMMASYQVTVTNLSEGQPLSPPAVILHRNGYHAWRVGSAASSGLEQLAEAGATDALLAEAFIKPQVKATMADTVVIAPGTSSSVMIGGVHFTDLAVSVASMLVNTNDGFTGVDGEGIGDLAIQESRSIDVMAFDAGTEANSESAATVPGPAAGGEGYNSTRDDRDTVGGHPGVVSADDGLAGSALAAAQRFDNPVARITITRLQ